MTRKAATRIPQLNRYLDSGLLLLRFLVAVVFITGGWGHVTKPEERGKSIGMSQGSTIFLGLSEVAGGLGLIFGVLTQFAAFGLMLIVLGDLQKKSSSGTPLWGREG
jgi:putative oxidoreductase